MEDKEDGDAGYADLLWETYGSAKDEQARSFALIALGRWAARSTATAYCVRSAAARSTAPGRTRLGVAAREQRARDDVADGADPIVVDALRRVLDEQKNPDMLASAAIALGLCGADSAVADIEQLLRKYKQRSFLGGYLCTSLALLGDDIAADPIRNTVEHAENQPKLLRRGAIALALLRQSDTARTLLDILSQGEASTAQVRAVAPALSRVGDHTVIDPS